MKKTSPKKLAIAKTTLRVLPAEDLAKVVGGERRPRGRVEHRYAAVRRVEYIHAATR